MKGPRWTKACKADPGCSWPSATAIRTMDAASVRNISPGRELKFDEKGRRVGAGVAAS